MADHTSATAIAGQQINERAAALDACLREMCAAQDQMLELLRRKHEAMRRSDVQQMLAASADEGNLAAAILAIEKKRLDRSVELCGALGLQKASMPLTIRAIAAKLPQPQARRLLDTAATLRERMLKVAEANRVVELVCQRMLVHFKALFSAMVEAAEPSSTYCPNGIRNKQTDAMVLDAVG